MSNYNYSTILYNTHRFWGGGEGVGFSVPFLFPLSSVFSTTAVHIFALLFFLAVNVTITACLIQ